MWTLQSADPAVLRLGHRNITSYFTVTGTTLYMTSHKGKCSVLNICVLAMILKPKSRKQRNYLTLSLPRVINSNVLFQSLTRDISYSNSPFESWLRWKLIEQSFLTTSLKHFLFEWLGEFALWAWDWKGQDLHDKGFPRKKRGCWKKQNGIKTSDYNTHSYKKERHTSKLTITANINNFKANVFSFSVTIGPYYQSLATTDFLFQGSLRTKQWHLWTNWHNQQRKLVYRKRMYRNYYNLL